MTHAQPIGPFGAHPVPIRRPDRPWLRRLLLFMACVVALDALVGERSFLQTIRADRDFRRAAIELSQLRRENARLRTRVRHLSRDPKAVEAVARKELGLIRRGELLVVLRDGED